MPGVVLIRVPSIVRWLVCIALLGCGGSGSSPAAGGGGGGTSSTLAGHDAHDAGNPKEQRDAGAFDAATSGSQGGSGGTHAGSGDGGAPMSGNGSSATGGNHALDAGNDAQGGSGEGTGGESGGGGAGGAAQAGTGGDASAAGTGGSGGSSAALCSGPSPAPANTSTNPLAIDAASPGRNAPGARTTVGASAPLYRLSDFQTLSCGTSQTYGLDSFRGHPTIVGLFASWCPYCLEQAPKLQQMQLELQLQNKTVYVVIINASPENSPGHDPIGDQYNLTSRVDFPLLQDLDSIKAWDLHGGIKDDLFIYRSDGTLQAYLSTYQGVLPNIDLTTDDGYTAVKDIVAGTP